MNVPTPVKRPAIGFSPLSLTEREYVFDTAEQHRIRIKVVVRCLRHPWSVALLPSGDALISERAAGIRFVHDAAGEAATLDPEPVAGLPRLAPARMKGGLHDVVLHPQFAQNALVYLTFNKAGDQASGAASAPIVLALLRGKLVGRELTAVEEIYTGPMRSPTGSRIAFGNDGKLYIATAVNFYDPQSQQLDSANGKVLCVLARTPAFTLTVVATLAIVIGGAVCGVSRSRALSGYVARRAATASPTAPSSAAAETPRPAPRDPHA